MNKRKTSTTLSHNTQTTAVELFFISALLIVAITQNSWAFNQEEQIQDHPIMDLRHCEQLYYRATELEALAQNRESPIYSDRNNNVASVVSTVFTPALYFLGYSKIKQFTSRQQAMESLNELDAVRNRMAALRCFQ